MSRSQENRHNCASRRDYHKVDGRMKKSEREIKTHDERLVQQTVTINQLVTVNNYLVAKLKNTEADNQRLWQLVPFYDETKKAAKTKEEKLLRANVTILDLRLECATALRGQKIMTSSAAKTYFDVYFECLQQFDNDNESDQCLPSCMK